MGNSNIRDFFNKESNLDQQKGFLLYFVNAEILHLNHFLG
jgi:hypothetical protein